MKKNDFYYDLPDELIAQYPAEKRTDSRLLVLDHGDVQHHQFPDFVDLINPGDLLVFNNTKVIPARLFGQKASGGKVEVLLERITGESTCLAHIRASGAPKPGTQLLLEGGIELAVMERIDDLYALQSTGEEDFLTAVEAAGHMPLPPYITREDEQADRSRYQTVYASEKGAVAAPTAGLHFDDDILQRLRDKGVDAAFVTLHVGAGTFQPVRVDDIKEHKMHAEYIDVSDLVCEKIAATKAAGKRVIAIGTTSVRSLETASQSGVTKPYQGDTDIFIYPGYQFQCVDALLTNFHLPESTLLMLVSAFAGTNNIRKAYQAAVDQRYRFFSYGDAMFLTRDDHAV